MRIALALLILTSVPTGMRAKDAEIRTKRSDDVTLSSLQTLVEQQAGVIQTLQSELAATKTRLDQQESATTKRLNAIEDKQSKAVAFTVRFSTDPATIGHRGTLKFNKFVTNIGGGYDPHTGIFTAPTSGIYVFYLSMMSDNTKWVEVALFRDGSVLDQAHADGHPTQSFADQGSLLVTTHLNKGQEVWLEQTGGAEHVRGRGWTVFSGYLLKAD